LPSGLLLLPTTAQKLWDGTDMITTSNEETVTVTSRPAVFEADVLSEQAYTIYRLAMEAGMETDEQQHKYRVLMGVANLLYDIQSGRCVVIVRDNYDNLGIY
jgi:hypothetical protein